MIEVYKDSTGVLAHDDLVTYETALRNDRVVSTRIALYDQNETHQIELLGPKSPISFIGGQVDVDTTAAVWRTLHLALLDPKRKLHLVENGSPADYQIWADTFISVERGDWVSDFGEFVWCPVFFGAITSFARSGLEVEITAAGKEMLALDPYLLIRSVVVPRGKLITTAINDVMTVQGEGNFALGNDTTKLHAKTTVPRLQSAWVWARKWAKTAGPTKVLFYDGKGRLKFVNRSTSAKAAKVWNFDTGDTGCLLSVPDVTFDFMAFRNFADVTGAAPTKKVPQPHAAEAIAASEGLSPTSLSRHSHDRYAISVVNDSQIGTQAKAKTTATDTLNMVKDLGWDATFDSLPIPHLEEKDWVWVDDGNGGQFTIQMNKWSIPLGGDSMSVGLHRQGNYTKKLKPVRVSRTHYHKPTKRHKKKHH